MEFFKKTLDPVIALVAIAVLDVFLFLIVGAWTVGGGETMMTGLAAQAIIGPENVERIPFWNLVFPSHIWILENLHQFWHVIWRICECRYLQRILSANSQTTF